MYSGCKQELCLLKININGVLYENTAENIPEEPDADNADVGSAHKPFVCNTQLYDPRFFRGFYFWEARPLYFGAKRSVSAVPERKKQQYET